MHRFMLMAIASVAMGLGIPAGAVTAGKILFAQPGTEIVNEKGERREARRGDSIEAGERLITRIGSVSQVVLPDGSLIGLRPGSEIMLDAPPPAGEKSAPNLSLVTGALRVIGSELMDVQKPSVLTLKSGGAILKLAGADLETAVVRSGDAVKPAGATDAGTYTRLLVGSGSIATASVTDAVLTQRQVAFVGIQPAAPVVISSLSMDVFNAPLPTSLRTAVASTSGTHVLTAPRVSTGALTSSLGSPSLVSRLPTVTTSTPLSSPVVPLPVISAVPQTPPLSPLITRTATTTVVAPRTTCNLVVIGGRTVCI